MPALSSASVAVPTRQCNGFLAPRPACPHVCEKLVTGRPCEVQEVSMRGATGGAFTLSYRGETTAKIPWDATSDELQTVLEVKHRDGTGEGGGGWTHVASFTFGTVDHVFLAGVPSTGAPAIGGLALLTILRGTAWAPIDRARPFNARTETAL